MSEDTNVELTAEMDALLDADLDDFADFPEFLVPPAGSYMVDLKFDTKKINDKLAIEANCTIKSAEELNDPNEVPPKAGDSFNQLFFMDNEYGQGAFKGAAKVLKEQLGVTSTRELIMATQEGIECLVITGVKKDKKDKTRLFVDIKEIHMV